MRRRRWPAALAGLAVLGLAAGARLAGLMAAADRSGAQGLGPVVVPVVLATVSAAAVGALLASRRPRHPVGWLLLGIGLGLAANVLVEPYVKYGLLVRSGSLPAAPLLVGFTYTPVVVWLSCAGFVLLLTPTGRLPSPRWRWWAGLAAAAPVVAVVATAVQPDPLAPDYHGNPWPSRRWPACWPRRAWPRSPSCWSRCWSGPGRWWDGSAAPAGPSASSCAGWPWRPPWPPGCCWSAWSPGTWAGT